MSERLTPCPILKENNFFKRRYMGLPNYSDVPTYSQLVQEIREFAYKLWELYHFDAEECWLFAERVLFNGLEKVSINNAGYRVKVLDQTMVITTKNFPVVFRVLVGQSVPQPNMLHDKEFAFAVPQECTAVTLCSALGKGI